MSELTSVQMTRKTSALLDKLAEYNKRTKAAQVEMLVETDFIETFGVNALDVTPGADDTEPVIIIAASPRDNNG